MSGFEVDQFTSATAREAFRWRQQALVQTIGTLGLQGEGTEWPALGFGGGAWALQGIDGYVDDEKPFDFDIVAQHDMFERLRQEGVFGVFGQNVRFSDITSTLHGRIEPDKDIPLPVDVFTSRRLGSLLPFTGGVLYQGTVNPAIGEMAGIFVVRPEVTALAKAMATYPRVRDLASLVKAHVVAAHNKLPIISNPLWHLSVGSAVGRLLRGDVGGPPFVESEFDQNYPSWLEELAYENFNHPAFATIPKL